MYISSDPPLPLTLPRRSPDNPQIDKTDELKPVADELGCTQAQLAVAWCLANPNVSTVLLGATKISQLDDNFGALQVRSCVVATNKDVVAALVFSTHPSHASFRICCLALSWCLLRFPHTNPKVVPKLTKEVMDRIDSIVNNPPKPSDIHQQVARMRQWPPKK